MPQRPMTTLGIAASVSTSAVTGPAQEPRRELGQIERDRDRERRRDREREERRDRGAEEEAAGAVELAAEHRVPGDRARRRRGRSARSPACAPSTSFHVIRPTRTVAPAAAAPATTWSTRSPKRTRRPEKGRRVDIGGELGGRHPPRLALDLLDRLLGDDEHRLRDRLEEQLRPEGLPLRDRPEEELPQVGCLRRLRRHDHVGVGRDRIRERELLRRVDDRELVRACRRLLVARSRPRGCP